MHRLVWAFVGRTYHIVGNLMSRLIYAFGCLILALWLGNVPKAYEYKSMEGFLTDKEKAIAWQKLFVVYPLLL